MNKPEISLHGAVAPLFRIAARPLERADWLNIDARLEPYRAEKLRLAAERLEDVFLAEAGTEEAQGEVLSVVRNWLGTFHPWVLDVETAATEDYESLFQAALLLPDDLLIMRRDASGWRLVAGALCFPSSWRLKEKFGRLLDDIHAPVPGFEAGTRNAQLIGRMFDNMKPGQMIVRGNWSLYGDDTLFHPDEADPDVLRFGNGARAEHIYLRQERQTLFKLEDCGDILFTVDITIHPLEDLERLPEGFVIARELARQIEDLSDVELAYKGLRRERGRVLQRLHELGD